MPMNPFPKVSIMIPTYGQQDFISNAISSALIQTYPDFEVIVVDDASPDHTAEKVAVFSDPRLRYVRNSRNLGRVGNYRRALYELATGEWVVNLDGDDNFSDADFIKKAIELAYSEPGIVIVSARRNVVTTAGMRKPLQLESMILSGKEVLLRYHDPRYHFSHLATLYHRPSALDCDFYRMNVISSDWESLLRLALTGKVAFLDCVVGCWNLHGSNASLNNCWQDLASNLEIWRSVHQTAIAAEIPPKTLRRAGNATLILIAYRDISLIFKGSGVFDAFKYLIRGFPILKTVVVLRILAHPYIWIKCALKVLKRVGLAKLLRLS
ncbi:glycosyltransferase family 2 protein [Pelotalea chapellei]|uniref:Glycosyltransferase family 2 protein n=1 Tax=Pelotalea chapellei TaxID=44671 RepID=A0ABS5U5L9_9BACT|nr:glycosyltransferase family 2 protein [Pelotalea chapellei]MBT1070968.1 glycosyltransferase family 2 protein [Pelotalea chapellei]